MSELAETFNAMKEHKKRKRAQRLKSANPEGWGQHTEHHWYRFINGQKINYWPSSGLCMIGNKKYNINSKFIRDLFSQEDIPKD